jgi:hypothetical protein
MVVIMRLLAVPVRFGGEEHSGWLPANAVTPPPTPVEDALVDFEIDELEGGYILAWYSRNTGHRGARKQAAQEYFSELFDPDLAVEVLATAWAVESTMCAKSTTWEGAEWVRTRSSPARSGR